ncbi:peritrophin-55-like [Condylostylus longicornis]|uniref:peritrophin-55-like n=1 Tax=Condylostylus longicornis TaxID=2530218 RepID=UPI00244DD92B|nr:peritrophin-55-like [Condylostylus longicornis]
MKSIIIFATLISLVMSRSLSLGEEPKCEHEYEIGSLWPDSNSEEHYYECVAIKKSIRLKCPENKLFDYVQQKCVHPDDRTPTTTPVTTTSTTECDTSPWVSSSTTTAGPI